MVYLDHNSTTDLLEGAKHAMLLALVNPMNPSSIHRFGREGRKIIEEARTQVAFLSGVGNCLNNYCITFTSSGTEANNLILSNFNDGEIFISAIEHSSIFTHLKFKKNIQIIPVHKNGIVDYVYLKQKLSESLAKKKLVSVIYANNETGVIQDIKKIAKIAHDSGALIHSDAVQAFGKIEVDLIDLDLDFMTVSSHKIGGPLGSGALISKKKHVLLPHIIGGGQEGGLRSGTENVAAIAGFGKAAEIVKKKLKIRYERLKKLRDYFEEKIVNLSRQIRIVNQKSKRLPNTSLIIDQGKRAEIQIIAFDLKNIALSSGSACSLIGGNSYQILEAMGFDKDVTSSAIRISFGESNTKEDVDEFLRVYKEINSK